MSVLIIEVSTIQCDEYTLNKFHETTSDVGKFSFRNLKKIQN